MAHGYPDRKRNSGKIFEALFKKLRNRLRNRYVNRYVNGYVNGLTTLLLPPFTKGERGGFIPPDCGRSFVKGLRPLFPSYFDPVTQRFSVDSFSKSVVKTRTQNFICFAEYPAVCCGDEGAIKIMSAELTPFK